MLRTLPYHTYHAPGTSVVQWFFDGSATVVEWYYFSCTLPLLVLLLTLLTCTVHLWHIALLCNYIDRAQEATNEIYMMTNA